MICKNIKTISWTCVCGQTSTVDVTDDHLKKDILIIQDCKCDSYVLIKAIAFFGRLNRKGFKSEKSA